MRIGQPALEHRQQGAAQETHGQQPRGLRGLLAETLDGQRIKRGKEDRNGEPQQQDRRAMASLPLATIMSPTNTSAAAALNARVRPA